MRMVFFFLTFVSLSQLFGCASVSNGTSGPIRVETVGSDGAAVVGARCDLTNDYGTFSVITPASVIVHKSSKDLQVTCKKDGYPDATANIISRVTGSMFGNILLGGGIGAIVDHSNGSAYNYPDWLKFVMGKFAIFDRKDFVAGAPDPQQRAETSAPDSQKKAETAAPDPQQRAGTDAKVKCSQPPQYHPNYTLPGECKIN